MITNNLSTLNIHQLSEQQFQRIVENNEYDENALYLTPDKEVLIVTIDEETGMASHTPAEIYAHVQSSGMVVLNEIDNWGITLNYMGGAEDYASFGAWLDELRSVYVTIYSDGHMDFREPNYVLSDAVDNKITRPNTAEVGQTIVVKSVDENGKPTEWEAVDLPSGEWVLLNDVTLTEDVTQVQILTDMNGNSLANGDAGIYAEYYIFMKLVGLGSDNYSSRYSQLQVYLNGGFGGGTCAYFDNAAAGYDQIFSTVVASAPILSHTHFETRPRSFVWNNSSGVSQFHAPPGGGLIGLGIRTGAGTIVSGSRFTIYGR